MDFTIKFRYRLLFAAVLATSLSGGCSRRSIYDVDPYMAAIPIKIDWAISNVNVSSLNRASVWFFPQDGQQPIEYRQHHNSGSMYTEFTVSVPVGRYSVLIFNETTDKTDWDENRMTFTGTNRYDTFAVESSVDTRRSIYRTKTKAEDKVDGKEEIVLSPMVVAVWHLAEFEVTQEMLHLTRTRIARALTRDEQIASDRLNVLIGIQPKPITTQVNIKAKVLNMVNAMRIEGCLKGLAGRVYLSTGHRDRVVSNVFEFAPNRWQWDNPVVADHKHGKVETDVLVLGFAEDQNYKLEINVVMNNGVMLPNAPVYDVNDQIDPESLDQEIEVGKDPVPEPGEPLPPDLPVILPDKIDGVAVGGWEDGGNIVIQ